MKQKTAIILLIIACALAFLAAERQLLTQVASANSLGNIPIVDSVYSPDK